MSVAVRPLFEFDDSFARELPGCPSLAGRGRTRSAAARAQRAAGGRARPGPDGCAAPRASACWPARRCPTAPTPVAQAYAGHQFGGYSPRLGDGRALLLGELLDPAGRRRDLHLKGSGRTPFARGGDGLAAVGPMLREYVISEAMHALGIPTTRSLAVVATGAQVVRETLLPGAVLARVARSHLRVGSFQYARRHRRRRPAARPRRSRHRPAPSRRGRRPSNPYLELFRRSSRRRRRWSPGGCWSASSTA